MSNIYDSMFPERMQAFSHMTPARQGATLLLAYGRAVRVLQSKIIPAYDQATHADLIANFRRTLRNQPDAEHAYGYMLSVAPDPEPPVSEEDTAQGTPIIESAGIPND